MPPLSRDRAATLLGVAPDAAPSTLRRAYRAAARRLHPDTLGRPARPAEVAAMAAVNAAYALLRRRMGGAARRPTPAPVRPPDRVIDMSESFAARPKPGPLRPIAAAPAVSPPTRPAEPPRPRIIRPRPTPPPVAVRHEPVPGVDADPATIRFDFGRYEGWSVADVEGRDPGYCDWVLRHARTPELRAALRAVRARRLPRTGS